MPCASKVSKTFFNVVMEPIENHTKMKFAHVVMSRSCIFILVTHLVTLFDFQISACIFVKRPSNVRLSQTFI